MTNAEIAPTIIPRIKSEMKKRKINISQLSKKTGMSYTTIWSILNRKKGFPAIDSLLKLLDGLGISASCFLMEPGDVTYSLSDGEIIVVEMMRNMNTGQREALINLVKQFQ